jgi:hypothetical protein
MQWTFNYDGGDWTAPSRVTDSDGDRCEWQITINEDGEFRAELDHPDVWDTPCFPTLAAAKDYCELREARIVAEQAEELVTE